ncbi:MAG: ABC transporter substrate-binding protein [Acidimicrobiales bacterium]
MKSWKLILALLAVFALLAAACGDDDDEGSTEAPSDDSAEPAPEPEPEPDDGASDDGASDDGATDDGGSGATFDVDAALDADLANCGEAPSGDPFIIGFAADFSEAGGFADIPIDEAARHWVDLINCSGGAAGTPVELVVEDVQGDPEVAQRATSDLIAAGAHVILGPPFADTGTAVLQEVEASRATIFVASTEPVLPDPAIWSYLTTFDDTRQAEAMAQFAIDQGFTRAITFSSEGPYFGYNPETFAAKFEELGGELVLDQSYVPFEDFDFAAQANEVAAVSDGTEILYTAMIAPQLDALRGQLEERGVEIDYAGADAFEVSGITEIPNNEGVYWTSHGFPENGNRFERLLISLEEAGTPSEAPGFAGLAGDSITMAITGFLDAGSADPAVIAEAIGQLAGVDAITDTITYAGTNGVPDTPVYILQINGGETVLAAKG